MRKATKGARVLWIGMLVTLGALCLAGPGCGGTEESSLEEEHSELFGSPTPQQRCLPSYCTSLNKEVPFPRVMLWYHESDPRGGQPWLGTPQGQCVDGSGGSFGIYYTPQDLADEFSRHRHQFIQQPTTPGKLTRFTNNSTYGITVVYIQGDFDNSVRPLNYIGPGQQRALPTPSGTDRFKVYINGAGTSLVNIADVCN